MSIDARQLRELIVRPTLKELALWSEPAEELLMGTAAKESELGLWIHQLGKGPALGIFQMEPETHDDCWRNFLVYKPHLVKLILRMAATKDFTLSIPGTWAPPAAEMVWNIKYACAMSRVRYLRVKYPLPTTLEAQAEYWDRWYNANPKAGTPAEYIAAYNRLVKGK